MVDKLTLFTRFSVFVTK